MVNAINPSNGSDLQQIQSNDNQSSYLDCFFTNPGFFISTSFLIAHLSLLLPLTVLILSYGFSKWQQRRSSSSTAALSPYDCVTYNMATLEFVGVSGCLLSLSAIYNNQYETLPVGLFLLSCNFYGETLFHILTSVERYLAVVHPVLYLTLKQDKGLRLRNVCIGFIWLLGFGCVALLHNYFFIVTFVFLTLSLTIACFCSLSILCVLIRPGPGEVGLSGKKIEKSKQRAFFTILAILLTLLLRFLCGLVGAALYQAVGQMNCLALSLELSFQLPSSLVSPVMFLQKEGKLSLFQRCTA